MISLFADAQKNMEAFTPKTHEKLPLTNQQCIKLVNSFPQETYDKYHYLMSQAVLQGIAKHLGEDEEYWGILGLLHDIDWAVTKEDVKEHTIKAVEILEEKGFSDEFIQQVQSHAYGMNKIPEHKEKQRTQKVEFALAAGETITGLIYTYALMRGNKISDMQVKGLKKKFKDKAFAAKVDREVIREIEQAGIPLDEFFQIAIDSIANIKEIIGLE
ncbi:MAG: putative nucleotidyltransferase with HDIG domain [Patescibacteria group bacterium]|jgi:putative nucleotidyltransferase with HDIG domain